MRKLGTGFVLFSALVFAQKFEYWPAAAYDPSVPTARSVLGHDIGDRVLSHANLIRYTEALAAAAPRRMKVFDYGKSWEGRRLIYAAIGSEENIRRLPEIKAAMQRLYDPVKTPAAEARKISASLPAVVWLGYAVHGNEISSPEAALQTMYHLLAARNDKMAAEILAHALVLIDPVQNPDGRDRFVHHYETAEGLEPDPNPAAAEHNEPWPGGRTNHYYFDLNRDWLAITQPETAGRIKALREWYPLVFVDLHEMGTESTYYFAPEAVPFNPHLTKDQKEPLEWFGKNNAKYFNQFGFRYFTREVYDAFFPGYGASWPAYYGGIAMTYENGSTRGLVVKRNSDDTTITFRETVRRHFVASLATCETAARNRAKLLENFYQYHVTAIQEGAKEPVQEYILPRRGNVSAVDRLAALMVEHGAEVQRATAPFKNGGAEYPAGSYIIPLAQPAKRLIRVLMDTQVSMDDAFLKEEDRRRRRRLNSEIYDVTAWSLPLQFGVESLGVPTRSQGSFEPYRSTETGAGQVSGKTNVAYLVPWGPTSAARFLAGALRQGLRLYSTDRKFVMNGRTYSAGTLIVKVNENPVTVHETVQNLAKTSGAEVVATESSWTEEGPNFGSRHVFYVRKPAVAIAWDRPVSAGSAGHLRFVIERQLGYPVTVVRTQQLASTDLSKFHVIILPEGGFGDGYAGVLGINGTRRLKDWVQTGGTLIGIGSALQYLASPAAGLLALTQENVAPGASETKPAAASPPSATPAPAGPTPRRTPGKLLAKDEDFEKAIQPDTELPTSAHGFLAKARVDQEHWLTAGVPETVHAMISGRSIYAPLKIDRGLNAAVFTGPGDVVASGYLWDEYRKQIAYKPLAVVQRDGRGFVIGFTADPNFRAYMDGLNVLFFNALFRGPGHAGSGPQFGEE